MIEQRKIFIREVVDAFKKRFPDEWEAACASAKAMRDVQANVYGSDTLKELRFGLRLPSRLGDILQKSLSDPAFLKEDDEYEWFRKEFRELTPSEVL